MIYFAATGGYVKVGITKSPKQRLHTLRSHSPHPVELMALVEGHRLEEKRVQDLIVNEWVRGEWYRDQGIVKAFLDGVEHREVPIPFGEAIDELWAMALDLGH